MLPLYIDTWQKVAISLVGYTKLLKNFGNQYQYQKFKFMCLWNELSAYGNIPSECSWKT